jgi:N-methylhydantoinase A
LTVSTETELQGLPILMPLVDIPPSARAALAAGSRASGHASGREAPADPGPCYGRGGTQPTVTDANFFLGRLDPDSSSATDRLDEDAAGEPSARPGESDSTSRARRGCSRS